MTGSNRYFLYSATANVADARALLENRSIPYTEADAIQDGIKELYFTVDPDVVQSIAQEIFNGIAKVYFSDKKLAITGSIGTISATVSATEMKTGSTNNSAGNATYLKTASDGTIVLPALTAGSNTIGNVGINAGSNSIGKVTLNNIASRIASHSNATMGGTSAEVVAANSGRKSLLIINDSDVVVYLKVNANAGTELSGDLNKHSFEEINRIVNANLTGNLFLLRELITSSAMSQGGQISVVGSIAADGNHDQLAYSASKSGLRGAIESLSRYDTIVKQQGLGIKLLEPAFVRTPMTERILKYLERRQIKPDMLARFREEKLVMESNYAASEILRLTTDSAVTGIRTIPEGINLHKIRETYF